MIERPERLPIVSETAGSRVALAVYAQAAERLTFVPTFLRAFAAVGEEALVEAWAQCLALHDAPGTVAATRKLAAAAQPDLPYRSSQAVRDAVAPFVQELPFLQLAVASFAVTLDGRLAAGTRPSLGLDATGAPRPSQPSVPEFVGEHPLFPEIRATYGTTYVPRMHLALAAHGLLEEAWAGVGWFLASRAGREHTDALRALAESSAVAFPDAAFLKAPGAARVVAEFRQALPLNLTFALAAGHPQPR